MNAINPQQEVSAAGRRILVIDDEMPVALCCARILRPMGHEVVCYSDSQAGLRAALSGDFDVILVDLAMPEVGGLEVIKQVEAAGVLSEVVVITGHASVESAVEAMKHGAADYLSKPFSPAQLRIVVQKVAERSTLIRENAALRQELELHHGFEGMIGQSRPMERVFSLIKRVAPTDGTVLITGESGTGKEMVARALHRLSRRKNQRLIACDCSGLVPTLLESELFGHVRGAFSGAVATKQGLFEVADKGTLFLDEVGNLTLETQAKLLRVLETSRVRKVGDTAEHEVDIRLITVTNRDLEEMVREKLFRDDLYYRLHVVPIHLPPLRERQDDIPLLAETFLHRICRKNELEVRGFTSAALTRMEGYLWPGNVRELRNVVERMAILNHEHRIDVQHLPSEIQLAKPRSDATPLPQRWDDFKRFKQEARDAVVQELERRFLQESLERSGGNVTRAAEEIGMQRTLLHALMRKYGFSSDM